MPHGTGLVSPAVILFPWWKMRSPPERTSREENSTRIRDPLGTPRGCCPYAFNGFHGTGLIALASTGAAGDVYGDEDWDYTPSGCAIFA